MGLRKRAITGGSRGIGLAIAKTLIDEGATVAVCARSADGVASAVAELGEAAWGEPVDVADPSAYATFLRSAIDHLGGLDIFIGNVAFTPDADAEARWKAAFDIDLMHCVRGCDTTMHALIESDAGAIVLISSVSNVMVELPPEEQAYGAMKAALVSLRLAQSAAADGVRANVVSPGPVFFEGGVWDQIKSADPEFFDFSRPSCARAHGHARGGSPRRGLPREPGVGFTTGANLRADGGTLKTVNS